MIRQSITLQVKNIYSELLIKGRIEWVFRNRAGEKQNMLTKVDEIALYWDCQLYMLAQEQSLQNSLEAADSNLFQLYHLWC